VDNDRGGWEELTHIWQINLEGMDDTMLGAALQHHIRHGHQWENSSYPPTPGKLWVALDKKREEEEERASLEARRQQDIFHAQNRVEEEVLWQGQQEILMQATATA